MGYFGVMRIFFVLLFGLAACGPERLSRLPDAGSEAKDAGQVDTGSTPVIVDSGIPPLKDAGPAPFDAGMQVPDTGAADGGPRDTGAPDVGVPAVAQCPIDLNPELALLQVPGVSAGIVKNGQLVCQAFAGHADIESNRPVGPDTIFAWASVSKAVTAVALLILHDQGRFQLDDPINNYLPFTVSNPSCPTGNITFRQIMTHSSSIIDSAMYDSTEVRGDSPLVLGDFLQGYVQPGGTYYSAQNFDYDCPGEWVDYSNVAVGLAGYLVEVISGQTFDSFCRDQIFTPLGMPTASFLLNGMPIDSVAMPYEGTTGAFTAFGHLGYATQADGSLRATVAELARFLAMVENGGELQGVRILSANNTAEMLRIQDAAKSPDQGLLWFTLGLGSRTGLWGHDGSDPGSSAYMFFDPADSAGVLLVANGDWYQSQDSAAADALMGRLFQVSENY